MREGSFHHLTPGLIEFMACAGTCTLLQTRFQTAAHSLAGPGFTATGIRVRVRVGMPAQQHCDSYSLLPAFYNGLKSKVGLATAKTAVMRINLNIDGCGVVAPPVHSSSRAPLLLANLLAHNPPLPRAAQ
eukprot:Tamp_38680.p2 GENE.Tamp_38680~~Tamp_38680.p2  ORF type:complete len:130 (+),score=7.45 Tamp_38680:3-392(+)